MIKAVIFDVGGVLLRTEDHGPRQRWDELLGYAPGETEELVFNSEMGRKAQRGDISDEALWRWLGETLGLDQRLEAFKRDFWSGDVLDEDLVAMIRSLRPAYQTAIISNATDALRQTLTNELGIADAFDVIVGSAEERVMKPSPHIFNRTLAALGRQPQEAVFIDDFRENVNAARELGMAAIHYQPGIDVAAALSELGIVVPQQQENRQ